MLSLRKYAKRLLLLVIVGYTLLCLGMYSLQKRLLFPAEHAIPVPADWQPSASPLFQQTMLKGACGAMHAVFWDTPNRHGIVMVLHGNGESMANVDHQTHAFLSRGYAVMSYDYAGYGLSQDCDFSQAQLLSDADTAFAWLTSLAKHMPITLYGHSLGTGISLYLASHHPVERVLLVSPYDAMEHVAQDQKPYIPIHWLIRYPLVATDWMQQAKAPTYIVHGTADTLIYPVRAQALQAASPKVNGQAIAKLTWVDGAGHMDITHFDAYEQWLSAALPELSTQPLSTTP